jgi:hypothetical protein
MPENVESFVLGLEQLQVLIGQLNLQGLPSRKALLLVLQQIKQLAEAEL